MNKDNTDIIVNLPLAGALSIIKSYEAALEEQLLNSDNVDTPLMEIYAALHGHFAPEFDSLVQAGTSYNTIYIPASELGKLRVNLRLRRLT